MSYGRSNLPSAMNRKSRFTAIAVGAFVVLLAAIAAISAYQWSKRIASGRSAPPSDSAAFAWLSSAMENCEKDAGANPQSLFFLVVPLAATGKYDQSWSARALESFGATTLFKSQDALDALNTGALRISTEPFVFHVLDVATSDAHRWSSASGVSKLSSKEIASEGPFRVRFQTAPGDPVREWNSVPAEGKGTCHWVFVRMRE
jgi:hypothetical protein